MPRAPAASKSPYSVHPSVAYAQAILANLPKTTGKSLQEWIGLLKRDGPKDIKARKAWLKSKHRVGSTTANLIAEASTGAAPELADAAAYLKTAQSYVEAMYAGPKAGLRPMHDALVALGRSMGDDVKVCPCKTIVPLYRAHVFAEIKPTTRTRIDLGLALKGVKRKPTKRLIPTGGLERDDRITHRIPIASLDDIDSDVERWLTTAYELDA